MAFLKTHGFYLAVGVLALAALGAGGWAFVGASDIEKEMTDVSELASRLRRLQSGAVNKDVIEAIRTEADRKQVEFEAQMTAALAMQKYNSFYEQIDEDGTVTRVLRVPLVPGVLPRAKSAVRIAFKEAYKDEFKKLNRRLRADQAPGDVEIKKQQAQLDQLEQHPQEQGAENPWVRSPAGDEDGSDVPARERPLSEILREWPQARAADYVARSIWMYVDDKTFGMHRLADDSGAPSSVEIWHAQMALWIQQDLATALARCNEERAEELRQQGVGEPFWVAQMPVKHLARVSIAAVLGEGGGSNHRRAKFARSFTKMRNSDKSFVVPVQLELVVEEAALTTVLEKLCNVGFYTVIAARYEQVETDPLFLSDGSLYVYGEEPVIQVVIDLEGYYFREVFEEWIPSALSDGLKKTQKQRGYRGRRG